MLFNSFEFIIFLASVLVLYYCIQDLKLKRLLLILASSFFVLQANLLSLVVIVTISVINYFAGIAIEKEAESKAGRLFFIIAILINMGNLFFFKYYNFTNENLGIALGMLGLNNNLPNLNIILPLGISFYTFSVIGYLIDVKLESIKPEKNFFSFLNYVFFFPKLLAGPIERAQNFLAQSSKGKTINYENFSKGGKLIIWGFFQKLVIADRISIYVDAVYGNIGMHSGITIVICLILYAFQIYADFSGYTDIARGIAKILGYELMENFRRPFLASSITEFWRRWHISLSSWVNDYVYTPLSLKYRNLGVYGIISALFISFIIVGIWHGALWTFVLFGFLQGFIITFELLTIKKRKKLFKQFPGKLTHFIGIIITFIVIALSLVFFRAPSFNTATLVFERIIVSGDFFIGTLSVLVYSFAGIAILLLRDLVNEYFKRDVLNIRSRFLIIRIIPFTALIIIILIIGVFDGSQFIYFAF